MTDLTFCLLAQSDRYECECCNLPLCDRKSPGTGYYCGRCQIHGMWLDECGRPDARYATHAEVAAAIDVEHAEMRRIHGVLREMASMK